jgi:hypothetical protein
MVPSHIGIISKFGSRQSFIHASPPLGRVEEAPLTIPGNLLGYIAFKS